MEYVELRQKVVEANRRIVDAGLVLLTWGNASAVDDDREVMAIKPSGVDYEKLTPEAIPIVRLSDGKVISGTYTPSSDCDTHLELYRRFPGIGGVVHTHSHYAVCFAQAQTPVPCLGTTHADHFFGDVPVTRMLTPDEISTAYERNTGAVIVETFEGGNIDPQQIPGVLVAQHGPFTWGATVDKAVENSIVLEEVARSGLHTYQIAASVDSPATEHLRADRTLVEKHFSRKHGPNAYYGQAGEMS